MILQNIRKATVQQKMKVTHTIFDKKLIQSAQKGVKTLHRLAKYIPRRRRSTLFMTSTKDLVQSARIGTKFQGSLMFDKLEKKDRIKLSFELSLGILMRAVVADKTSTRIVVDDLYFIRWRWQKSDSSVSVSRSFLFIALIRWWKRIWVSNTTEYKSRLSIRRRLLEVS